MSVVNVGYEGYCPTRAGKRSIRVDYVVSQDAESQKLVYVKNGYQCVFAECYKCAEQKFSVGCPVYNEAHYEEVTPDPQK